MNLFLDSAKLDEIQHAMEHWDVDGLTTNPRHVRDAGLPFRKSLEQIAAAFAGTDKPVSVEIDPHLADHDGMVTAARELVALSSNFVIKIAAGEQGFRAIRTLSADGVRTNATLVFSVAQAWHAARAGATYISPFLGWKEAHGDKAETLVPEIRAMLDQNAYGSQIIAAAIRNSRQIADAAIAGADCVTASFATYQDSFRHPFTDHGQRVFEDAWDATPRD